MLWELSQANSSMTAGREGRGLGSLPPFFARWGEEKCPPQPIVDIRLVAKEPALCYTDGRNRGVQRPAGLRGMVGGAATPLCRPKAREESGLPLYRNENHKREVGV